MRGSRALQIEQRAHDVDVEVLRRRTSARRRSRRRVPAPSWRAAPRSAWRRAASRARPASSTALSPTRWLVRRASPLSPPVVGVVGLLQRVDEPAQVIVGVVGHVRRHLRIAEVGLAGAMRRGAQRADQMRLAGAGLAVEQQDARLRRRRRAPPVTASSSSVNLRRAGAWMASTSTGSARQMSSSQVIECSKAADRRSACGARSEPRSACNLNST